MPLVFAIKAKNHENNNNSNDSKTTRALIYRQNICILLPVHAVYALFLQSATFPARATCWLDKKGVNSLPITAIVTGDVYLV